MQYYDRDNFENFILIIFSEIIGQNRVKDKGED